jgi:hypothetical protein
MSRRTGAPEARNIQPRQMQSITWEAMRGLLNPAERSGDAFKANIDELWRQYKAGRLSLRTTQQRIMRDQTTGLMRIRRPQWVTGDNRLEDEDSPE